MINTPPNLDESNIPLTNVALHSYAQGLRTKNRSTAVPNMVPYHVFEMLCAGCLAEPRFAAAHPRYRSAWDQGAWLALPAATYNIPGASWDWLGSGLIGVKAPSANLCVFAC